MFKFVWAITFRDILPKMSSVQRQRKKKRIEKNEGLKSSWNVQMLRQGLVIVILYVKFGIYTFQ